ncbi:MAG: hypothetical protein COB60_01385 [Flavobacteriaceae bacterium]|nr:MAG: hypothetical protein COB60_01385 [Flavobacteriaceae bacterium]
MKISNILIILSIAFAVSCTPKKKKDDHGHEHKAGEEHAHEEAPVKQETFTVESDSIKKEATKEEHKHDENDTNHKH